MDSSGGHLTELLQRVLASNQLIERRTVVRLRYQHRLRLAVAVRLTESEAVLRVLGPKQIHGFGEHIVRDGEHFRLVQQAPPDVVHIAAVSKQAWLVAAGRDNDLVVLVIPVGIVSEIGAAVPGRLHGLKHPPLTGMFVVRPDGPNNSSFLQLHGRQISNRVSDSSHQSSPARCSSADPHRGGWPWR